MKNSIFVKKFKLLWNTSIAEGIWKTSVLLVRTQWEDALRVKGCLRSTANSWIQGYTTVHWKQCCTTLFVAKLFLISKLKIFEWWFGIGKWKFEVQLSNWCHPIFDWEHWPNSDLFLMPEADGICLGIELFCRLLVLILMVNIKVCC